MQVARDGSILRACHNVSNIARGIDIQAACAASEKACSPNAAPGPVCEEEKVIDSIWRIQLHIRQHGGVVTRLNVINPKALTEFFKRKPKGVFNSTAQCVDWPECGVPYGHAVLLVGYNNTADPPHWIVWTSWGTDFADGGIFRVAYGIAGAATGSGASSGTPSQPVSRHLLLTTCLPPLLLSRLPHAGIGNKPDTYGLRCQVANRAAQLARRLRVLPVQGGTRCYNYTVDTARTPTWSAVAASFGVSIAQLVQTNRVQLAFKRFNETVLQNETLPDGAKACALRRTCGDDGLPRGSNLTCLLSVTKSRSKQAAGGKEPALPNCTLTWVRADVSVPLKRRSTLTLCGVPVSAFWGSENSKLSGAAVPGAGLTCRQRTCMLVCICACTHGNAKVGQRNVLPRVLLCCARSVQGRPAPFTHRHVRRMCTRPGPGRCKRH